MRIFLDTSFLVASVLESHPHHRRTLPWLRAIASKKAEAVISWHVAAETWSVLTRLPGAARLAPATASMIVDRLLDTFQTVEVTGSHYRAAIRRSAERGLRSGAVFDALHLAVAESEATEALVTFNGDDFERLRADSSPKVLIPPDPPAFSST